MPSNLALAALALAAPGAAASTYFPAVQVVRMGSADVQKARGEVAAALNSHGFNHLGTYHPGRAFEQGSAAYTAPELQELARKVGGAGALAAVLRINLVEVKTGVLISYLDPDYVLRAYLGPAYATLGGGIPAMRERLEKALATLGTVERATVGGGESGKPGTGLSAEQLEGYRFMIGAPNARDLVEVGSAPTMAEAKNRIEQAVTAKRGGTQKVYVLDVPGMEATIYGIALQERGRGEPALMSLLGKAELLPAAFPLELLLYKDGNRIRGVMLDPRFRLPLYFPAISMGTYLDLGKAGDGVQKIFTSLLR
jgi:hypothetical protein